MESTKLKILIRGIKLKAEATGTTIDEILASYTKLTEDEKQELRCAL